MSNSKELLGIIKDTAQQGTKPFDTEAEVIRVEGDTVWVHMPAGVDETPVQKTINAKVGDTVQVRVANGSAWLVGNASAPPTDDGTAMKALDYASIANEASKNALNSAATAKEAADDAKATADSVRVIAVKAQEDAAAAQQAAEDAETAAGDAQTSADSARASADNALTQLGYVEDVVGVLNWIAEHGTYKVTTDTEVTQGKLYFTRTGSGTEADPYVYTVVTNPTGNPSSQGWYELDSVDEAISNFIRSHVVLTDDGLYVMADDSEWKVLVASDGVYILDPNGVSVNSMTSSLNIIGIRDSAHIEVSSERFSGFNEDSVKYFDLAYNGGSTSQVQEISVQLPKYDLGVRRYYTSDLSAQMTRQTVRTARIAVDEYISASPSIFASMKFGLYCRNPRVLSSRGATTRRNGNFFDVIPTFRLKDNAGYESRIVFAYEVNDETQYTILYIVKNPPSGGTVSISYAFEYRHLDTDLQSGMHNQYLYPTFTATKEVVTTAPSFTLGTNGSQTSGLWSIRLGEGVVAEEENQIAVGKFNDNKATNAFEIGNGTDDTARSNALELDWSGNLLTAGDITDGSGNVLSEKVDSSSLAAVATSGDYADLTGTPNLAAVATSGAYSDLTGTPNLAAVATSGAYSDLTGTPNLAPVATTGDYEDLTNTPNLATVATSGSYNDLTNKPSNATTSAAGFMSAADKTTVDKFNFGSGISNVNFGDGTNTEQTWLWGNATNKVAVGAQNTADDKRYNWAARANSMLLLEGGVALWQLTGLSGAMNLGAIGTYYNNESASVSTSSGTAKNLLSRTLPAGTWLITGSCEFPANTTGRRAIQLSTTSAGDAIQTTARDVQSPVNGGPTICNFTTIVQPTANTTYYLVGYQNSGSALNVKPQMQCVRIKI